MKEAVIMKHVRHPRTSRSDTQADSKTGGRGQDTIVQPNSVQRQVWARLVGSVYPIVYF